MTFAELRDQSQFQNDRRWVHAYQQCGYRLLINIAGEISVSKYMLTC